MAGRWWISVHSSGGDTMPRKRAANPVTVVIGGKSQKANILLLASNKPTIGFQLVPTGGRRKSPPLALARVTFESKRDAIAFVARMLEWSIKDRK
jgi:hypothetical protein